MLSRISTRVGRMIVFCAVLGLVSCHTYHRPSFKTVAIQPIRPFNGTEIPLLAYALHAYSADGFIFIVNT